MAIRKIVTREDPVLRKRSRPIDKIDERTLTLLDDMYDTMKDVGVGIAAVQVGVLRRAVVIDIGDEHGRIDLINPEIIERSGEQEEIEGCLSCPGENGYTLRPMKVTVRALDRNGKEFTITGEGLLARAFCHELDHLDGILFTDKVTKMIDLED